MWSNGGFATHPERRDRQRHVAQVRTENGHVGLRREAAAQAGREVVVDLDREHRRSGRGKRRGDRAGARAEVERAVRGRDTGVGDELRRQPFATEEVLAELSRPASRAPGHGAP